MSQTGQENHTGTAGEDYTRRLQRLGGARWKQVLDVQAPYRWNLRRLQLGRTLDVGSGLGRNLINLGRDSVGVDHNPTSVAHCRELGLEAYTTEEFLASEYARPGAFDSMLAAHLLEHMPAEQAREVISMYLPYLRSGGRAVFITPQERGYRSDATHVRFVGFAEAAETCRDLGLTVERQYSFPFPRAFGKLFTYNEFITVARLP
ncbi:class I SAM-dependent methyltransferase [Micromonospora sp. C28SCA-DRY-2]|uniref:class I SAM-dependent methyltransferase n=1 Tax=Micromonospora sp. C28SCA-DRY-2 TaxID=3059522 RepID=UPI0026746E19|nr:class I SAM-dependent methyltransferase [Micromonospora sp. C28SCA-DRY-2]MDO3704383.1 class I SAM-dependent methyltransferase [Micromonospora sp. C28SCA-DRY-2]